MAKNSSYEARRIAPMPVAESTKYTVFAAMMPPMDHTARDEPRVSACDSTRSTAGPGVKHRAVSTTKNMNHVLQVMAIPIAREGGGLHGTAPYGLAYRGPALRSRRATLQATAHERVAPRIARAGRRGGPAPGRLHPFGVSQR